MYKNCILILLFLLSFSKLAYAQWAHVSTPGGSIFITSENIGYSFSYQSPNPHSSTTYYYKTNDCWQTKNFIYSQSINYDGGFCEGLYFLDSLTGFKVYSSGNGTSITKTNNGGLNWSSISYRSYGMGAGVKLNFLRNNFGYYYTGGYGRPSTLYKYSNGSDDLMFTTNQYRFKNTNFNREDLVFINASTGFILCKDSLQKNDVCIRTFDYGNSWVPVISDSSMQYNEICFSPYNKQVGYIVGSNGTIYKTVNSGNNWFNISIIDTINLNSVYFINDTIGYVVGDSSLILKTIDGGLSWTKDTCPVSDNLVDVKFVNDSIGFILTNKGLLLKTGNLIIGIREMEELNKTVQLFPNPSAGIFNLEFHKPFKHCKMNIYTINGELILTRNIFNRSTQINLPNSGLYILKIDLDNQILYKKVVVYE